MKIIRSIDKYYAPYLNKLIFSIEEVGTMLINTNKKEELNVLNTKESIIIIYSYYII